MPNFRNSNTMLSKSSYLKAAIIPRNVSVKTRCPEATAVQDRIGSRAPCRAVPGRPACSPSVSRAATGERSTTERGKQPLPTTGWLGSLAPNRDRRGVSTYAPV
ncbi:unnamed protein product [Triticum turgidum subsp. durum]|uniref:Uncharacterized protein n=1 Tax=Triticum turgidum subsp. durum TaxID=4567 RepID=A0A9R0Q3P2_TRITD|nr:unnamed protein product [Triticum turgidum subsp. durum]